MWSLLQKLVFTTLLNSTVLEKVHTNCAFGRIQINVSNKDKYEENLRLRERKREKKTGHFFPSSDLTGGFQYSKLHDKDILCFESVSPIKLSGNKQEGEKNVSQL